MRESHRRKPGKKKASGLATVDHILQFVLLLRKNVPPEELKEVGDWESRLTKRRSQLDRKKILAA